MLGQTDTHTTHTYTLAPLYRFPNWLFVCGASCAALVEFRFSGDLVSCGGKVKFRGANSDVKDHTLSLTELRVNRAIFKRPLKMEAISILSVSFV